MVSRIVVSISQGAAEELLGCIKTIEILVRWKPLEQQPIGWHPDLNDGVRLNIRPFMEADLSAAVPAGRQGQAGVLRKRPNIKWGKDRGKNPPGSP